MRYKIYRESLDGEHRTRVGEAVRKTNAIERFEEAKAQLNKGAITGRVILYDNNTEIARARK